MLAGEKFRQRVVDKPAKAPGGGARAVMNLRKRLIAWNEAPAPPTRMSPEVERDIRERFSADVDMLAGLIGRDLSHWLGRGETN